MRKLTALTAAAAMVAAFGIGAAWAAPDDLYPRHAGLEADGEWLIAHYDDRDLPTLFDDGADIRLFGKLPNHKHTQFHVGEFMVEASAAWNWTVYESNHPSALVYNESVTMPPLHTHAGCTTDAGGGDHTFTATIVITTEHGVINANILGGMNNERRAFPSDSGGHGDCPSDPGGGSPYEGSHTDTDNEVLITFEFDGSENSCEYENVSGGGVLQFVYNTLEPHELLEASIILDLEGTQAESCD